MVGVPASPAAADLNLGTVDGLTYMQGSYPATLPPPPANLYASATCPAGTQVVGGGATPSSSPLNEFWLNRIKPFDGSDSDTRPDDGWVGRGFNRFGTTKNFGVYAICFNGTVRYGSAQRSARSGRGMAATASCPAGTHVSGGGAALSGSSSKGYLNASYPIDSGDAGTVADDGWRARAFNKAGTRKTLTVYAECTNFTPQYQSAPVTTSSPLVSSACAGPTHAMEGGVSPSGPPSGAFLNTNYPFADPTNPPDAGFVTGLNKVGGGTINLLVYLICKT